MLQGAIAMPDQAHGGKQVLGASIPSASSSESFGHSSSCGEMLLQEQDAPSDVEEDGVHGGRMKPLASFDLHKAQHRSSSFKIHRYAAKSLLSPVRCTPLKVIAAARVGRRARERVAALTASGAAATDKCGGPVGTDVERNGQFSIKHHMGIKRKRFSLGSDPEGSKMQSLMRKRRSSFSAKHQCLRGGSDRGCSQETATLPLLSCFESESKTYSIESPQDPKIYHPSYSQGPSQNTTDSIVFCRKQSFKQSARNKGLESSSKQVKVLQLFQTSHSRVPDSIDFVPSDESSAQGLDLLGQAACLSLALDENISCLDLKIGCQGDSESAGCAASDRACKMPSDDLPTLGASGYLSTLGADLFLGLPRIPSSNCRKSTNVSWRVDTETDAKNQSRQSERPCQAKPESSARLDSLSKNIQVSGDKNSLPKEPNISEAANGKIYTSCSKTNSIQQGINTTSAAELDLLSVSSSEAALKVSWDPSSDNVAGKEKQETSQPLSQPLKSLNSQNQAGILVGSGSSGLESSVKPKEDTSEERPRCSNEIATKQCKTEIIARVSKANICSLKRDANSKFKKEDFKILGLVAETEHSISHIPSKSFQLPQGKCHQRLDKSTNTENISMATDVSKMLQMQSTHVRQDGCSSLTEGAHTNLAGCFLQNETAMGSGRSLQHDESAFGLSKIQSEDHSQKLLSSQSLLVSGIANALTYSNSFECKKRGNAASVLPPTFYGGSDPARFFPYELLQNTRNVRSHSSTHVQIANLRLPKVKRGRQPKKARTDCLQKKETADKFAQFSAPSGLLGDVNPGIITRIRNSKQVHAILGAVVGCAPDKNVHEKPIALKRQEDRQRGSDMELCHSDVKREVEEGDPSLPKAGVAELDHVQITERGRAVSCENENQPQVSEATVENGILGCKNSIENALVSSVIASEINIALSQTGQPGEPENSGKTESSGLFPGVDFCQSGKFLEVPETVANDKPNMELQALKSASQGQMGTTYMNHKVADDGHFPSSADDNRAQTFEQPTETVQTSTSGQAGTTAMQKASSEEEGYWGSSNLSDKTFAKEAQEIIPPATAVSAAAKVAARWLELLRLDIKGRLSALKRSRRRVRSLIVSGELDKDTPSENIHPNLPVGNSADAVQKTCFSATESYFPNDIWDKGYILSQHELEMDRWRALFLSMDGVLSTEGAKLESWLGQIQEMQAYCPEGQICDSSKFNSSGLQTAGFHGHPFTASNSRYASVEMMEKDLALAASAASILCTAQFASTMEVQI